MVKTMSTNRALLPFVPDDTIFMMNGSLKGKTILVTGGARRVGRIFALACAHAGADVVIHHGNSEEDALKTRNEIENLGCRAWVFEADFSDPS